MGMCCCISNKHIPLTALINADLYCSVAASPWQETICVDQRSSMVSVQTATSLSAGSLRRFSMTDCNVLEYRPSVPEVNSVSCDGTISLGSESPDPMPLSTAPE